MPNDHGNGDNTDDDQQRRSLAAQRQARPSGSGLDPAQRAPPLASASNRQMHSPPSGRAAPRMQPLAVGA